LSCSPEADTVSGMDKEISFPALIPQDLQNTFRWLLKVEEFQTVKKLAFSVFKYLPQTNPEASDFMAMTLHKAKFYKDAVPFARKTVELLPTPEAKFNLAKCLNSAALPWEAETTMAEVMRAKPEWLDPKIDHAVYVSMQGRCEEAEASLRKLLVGINPADRNYAVVKFNLGWHEVRNGNFKTGVEYLGIGRKLRIWGAYSFPYSQPMLEPGMNVEGKTILLVGEGGAGDEIINCRFGQILKARGASKIIFTSNQKLQALLSRTPGLDQVITHKDTPPKFDYWAPAMDLPRILGITAEEIPKNAYVNPHPDYVKKWKELIKPSKKLRVGIRWQGNSLYEQDLMRSVPFTMMESFLQIPDVELYSLQKDDGLEERPANSPVVDLSAQLETWEDTSAAISQLDLIISSCTSVPHLASAMGKPVWLFCPINSYYVWAGPDNGKAWYPNVELIRQKEFGSWDDTYKKIFEKLKEAAPRF